MSCQAQGNGFFQTRSFKDGRKTVCPLSFGSMESRVLAKASLCTIFKVKIWKKFADLCRSIVIEDAMKDFNNGYSPHPAFFYCSRTPNEPARSNPEAILASIVRQLSCHEPGQPLHDSVVTIYRKEEAKGFPSGALHIDASYALILQVVEQYPLTTIVIDALDECDPEKRSDLLEVLEKILQVSPNLIKVFVSSRDDQDIVCHLKQYPDLGITSDRNGDDITRFVRHEVHELIRKRKLLRYSHSKEEMEKVIIDKVTEGSAGM